MYLIFMSLVAVFGLVANSNFEMLRDACPYSNFCTTNSLKNISKAEYRRSCCYECFCDEHCSMFGDCCPDVETNTTKPETAALACKPVHIATDRAKMEIPSRYVEAEKTHVRYRLIDFCPPAYEDSAQIIEQCNGTFAALPQYSDLVLVSDSNGRIFKNKYCATCNGVHDITSWDLRIVTCAEDISKVQLTLSEARFYILNYCLLTQERPPGVKSTARSIPCPDNPLCLRRNPDLAGGCTNGPYMPYMDVTRGITLYKNVLCYKFCTGRQEGNMCPDYSSADVRFSKTSYQVLLNLRPKNEPVQSESTTCGEAELKDGYTDKCKRLYCPPFEAVSYGKCVSMSRDVTDLLVTVNVIFTIQNNGVNLSFDRIDQYNETIEKHFLKNVNDAYSFTTCKINELALDANREKASDKFVRLVLMIVYAANEKCTMKRIGDHIRQRKGLGIKETWLIQDKWYEMEGQFSFSNNLYNDPNLRTDLLMFATSGILRFSSIHVFFLCPYFKLSFEEYLDHVERSGKKSEDYELKALSPSSQYLEGFYPLPENEVAVCVDMRLARSGQGTMDLHSIFVLTSILVVLWYLEILFW